MFILFIKNKKQLPIVSHFDNSGIKIFALGGLGEIGKNMYCLEIKDELMIIDSGILFPDDNYGIDYIIPDYTYLKENEKKIVGLFISHGHEDHIGGIPYLLRDVKIPKVYASGLAYQLIVNKMKEFRGTPINLVEFSSDSVYNFKNFQISFFRTNHSIPDSFGIAIKTSLGYILHTGDFKFDFSPLTYHTEYSKITRYADAGVKLLLSDSTNATVSKFTTSERKIGKSIRAIMETIKGRVIISTFASNVHRIQQIVEASVDAGRKVIVFGRSMEKNINVGQQLEYIKAPEGTFINANEFTHLPPNKITILSTGSQGEPLAALSRIANGTHRTIKIIPGDTIVFSSNAIPGNQESINQNINKLYRAGAEIIVNSPLTDTHTSGHASQIELQIMLSLVKPEYFVPIHGEYSMMKTHSRLAMETGVDPKKIFILGIGDVLSLEENNASIDCRVKTGNIYIDSKKNIVDREIINERKALSDDGMLSLIMSFDKDYNLTNEIAIVSRGFIYMKEAEQLLNNVKEKAMNTYLSYKEKNKVFNEPNFKNMLNTYISNYIYELTERRPIIIPIIMKH